MLRSTYIAEILRQHLQDKKGTYRRIDCHSAHDFLTSAKLNMAVIVSGNLPPREAAYFTKKLLDDAPPCDCVFYGTAKLHKDKLPTPLWPVVSQCGSLMAIASTYLDHKLQPLKSKVQSYITDSYNLILKLI